MRIPSACSFCGARRLVANNITGIAVYACHTAWDSQRVAKEQWRRSDMCREAEAAKGGACDGQA